MLKPVGSAPGKQVQVLKGLWEKCSWAQIEKLPRRLSQGSLSSNFRTSLSYFEQADVSRSLEWGMQGKLRSKCFMAVLALGVRRRCIYVALAGKPGCQVGPGPGWPRDTTNLPQQPSWIPFLLTLFFFPPQSISLSFSLNFSFLLTLFLFPPRFISLSFSHYFFPPRFFLPWPWPSFWFCVDGWRGNNWRGRVRKVKIAVEDNGWAKNKQWSAALNFVFV